MPHDAAEQDSAAALDAQYQAFEEKLHKILALDATERISRYEQISESLNREIQSGESTE